MPLNIIKTEQFAELRQSQLPRPKRPRLAKAWLTSLSLPKGKLPCALHRRKNERDRILAIPNREVLEAFRVEMEALLGHTSGQDLLREGLS